MKKTISMVSWCRLGRRQFYNRLHPDYPYFRPDGTPDLVYDDVTSVYPCPHCDGLKCETCMGCRCAFCCGGVECCEHCFGMVCQDCKNKGCSLCFGSGYLFIDSHRFHNLVNELYQKRLEKKSRLIKK
jgi:hypothetical protein